MHTIATTKNKVCHVIATGHTFSLFKGFYFSKKLFEFMSSKVYFNYLPRVQLVFVYFVANILQSDSSFIER